MPEVSVIIPYHEKRKDVVNRAIESVLKQTYQDFEVFCVSDGLFEHRKIEHPKVTYLTTGEIKPSGTSALPRNIWILNATGDYIALLDSDDHYLPTFLEETIDAIQSQHVDIVFTYCHLDDGAGGSELYEPKIKRYMWPDMLTASHGPVSGSLIRKECFDNTGRFDVNSPTPHHDMWIRLAKHYSYACIEKPLVVLDRVLMEQSYVSRHKKNVYIYNKHRKEYEKYPHILEDRLYKIVYMSFKERNTYRLVGDIVRYLTRSPLRLIAKRVLWVPYNSIKIRL